ncbi:uncharacterized protein EV697_101118 [Bisgaardia hudsonensis]|uniref:Radical SAM core domain-containing protein n=1 Tax=Bisgaardia hudsonensis TaxID=109472 RepID=A0A4R2N2E8_9PAST|nr:anaerobic sulfatase maturase [Bisgaardia hudsonensis]QLB12460.1 anaerobic sulfatase maturase [Bisgaardia hudsonensis]TCP13997.1 uncharacterized protein EV697_101118 [Bisgaardia hudsonensis]
MPTSKAYFHLMAKPSSYHCNIKCEYCFYLEKEHIFQHKTEFMSDDVLKHYIQNYIDSHAGEQIDFAWQGGEPTLLGIDFFKQAVKYQKQFSKGKKITNSFQTNGIAINRQWAEFFKVNHFLIGISIDGLSAIHNKYRISVNGKPTFERVKSAVELLNEFQVDFNTLTVVNDQNWNKGKETYLALKELGSTFMQFIPVVEINRRDEHYSVTDFSVKSDGYGRFLVDVFNEWIKQDIGKIFVIEFDNLLGQWLGYPSNNCVHRETCGRTMVVESNGDVYSCDHYVYPKHYIGNLTQQSLSNMVNSKQQISFGMEKKTKLSPLCKSCELRPICHGGCPKHRIVKLPNTPILHNYLCPSYQLFFRESAVKMREIAQRIRQGNSL